MKCQRLDVKCNQCESAFEKLMWSPERKCPKCGAMALVPVVKVEGEGKSPPGLYLAKLQAKSKSIKAIAITAAAIAAIFLIPSLVLNEHDSVLAICSNCGNSCYERHFPKAPGLCRKCGKDAVYPAVKCAECGTIYGDKTAEGDIEEDEEIGCPNCGSMEIKNIKH